MNIFDDFPENQFTSINIKNEVSSDSEDEVPPLFYTRPQYQQEDLHLSRFFESPIIKFNDEFFILLYEYHQNKGFLCILLQRVTYLLTIIFTFGFSVFITMCVDWNNIHNGNHKDLFSAIYPMCKPENGRNGFLVFIYLIFFIWITIEVFQNFIYLKKMYMIRNVWKNKLNFYEPVNWTNWQQVIDASHDKINQIIDSHYMINRIMRFDNYLIGMITRDIFGNYF